jgi:hypothetical protein
MLHIFTDTENAAEYMSCPSQIYVLERK